MNDGNNMKHRHQDKRKFLMASALTATLVMPNLGGLNLASAANATFYATPTGSDKFVVHGGVQLAGMLNFFRSDLFNFTAGTRLTLIDNDGTDPVQGTFAGVPEGSLLLFQPVARSVA